MCTLIFMFHLRKSFTNSLRIKFYISIYSDVIKIHALIQLHIEKCFINLISVFILSRDIQISKRQNYMIITQFVNKLGNFILYEYLFYLKQKMWLYNTRIVYANVFIFKNVVKVKKFQVFINYTYTYHRINVFLPVVIAFIRI